MEEAPGPGRNSQGPLHASCEQVARESNGKFYRDVDGCLLRRLGEDEDWLRDVASETEVEDGVIWVYGVGKDGVLAFTDFGIESLIELIKMYKDDPSLLKRYDPQ
jgi:hypothetical protein